MIEALSRESFVLIFSVSTPMGNRERADLAWRSLHEQMATDRDGTEGWDGDPLPLAKLQPKDFISRRGLCLEA
jgi:hypothetical protein